MDLPENALQRAVILDFRLRLENHYKVFLGISPNAAMILDFRPRIGNHCSTIVAAVGNGPPAAPSLRL